MSVHRDSFESTYLMTKSYAQIVKQIESLKQEAEKARRKEIEGVVGRIRDAIAVYGLTADDLGLGPKAKRGRKPKHSDQGTACKLIYDLAPSSSLTS